jgi:hypothetical protein
MSIHVIAYRQISKDKPSTTVAKLLLTADA